VPGALEAGVTGERRVPRQLTAEETAAILAQPIIMVSYSRCMFCGRRTPHEWCHACYELCAEGGNPFDGHEDQTWWRADEEPETCEYGDADCPVIQRWAESVDTMVEGES
jgi:hypothetical protein